MKTTIRAMTRWIGASGSARAVISRLTRRYGLRSVLYHEIAEAPSEFTLGLNVTTSPSVFSRHIETLVKDHRFVSIDQILDGGVELDRARPPLLVTFDDAYASVAGIAADVCHQAGVPSAYFVNGACVDNETLGFDNLVAWTVNNIGMTPLTAVAGRRFADLSEFFGPYLSSISLGERMRIYDELAAGLPGLPAEVAADADLYVTSPALASLDAKGMVVGNHTWSHVYCRQLDRDSLDAELGRNKRFLESIVSKPVEVFSYPYGSRLDANDVVTAELVRLGNAAAFLVEAEANRRDADTMRLSRISVGEVGTADLFSDVEILPVLRRARSHLERLPLRRRAAAGLGQRQARER